MLPWWHPPPLLTPFLFIFAIFSSTKTSPPPSAPINRHAAAAAKDHEMVGLSIILESHRDLSEKRSPQVLSKGSMIKPPSNPSSPTTPTSPVGFSRRANLSNYSSACGFLDHCFLCKQKLLPGKDIYMYNGDKAFCSVECRCRQIFMDEEEVAANKGCTREYKCSMASSSAASSSSPSSSRGGKGPRNRANAFAY